jgi:hypothetical protein
VDGVISVPEIWDLAAFQGFGQYADKLAAISRGEFPLNKKSGAYVTSLVVATGARSLFGFSGFSSNVAGQWIQWHDASKVPASGAVPEGILYVGPNGNFGTGFTTDGRRFWSGIILVNSTTGPTYTPGAADTWFDVQYV